VSERYEDGSEHDPDISAIYRKTGDLAPPTSLDDRILAAARRAAWRRKQRWILPLSTAAVVVLSVTLLINMNDEWDLSQESRKDSSTSQALPAVSEPERQKTKERKPSLSDKSAELTPEAVPQRLVREVRPEKPAPMTTSPSEDKTKKSVPPFSAVTTDIAGPRSDSTAPTGELTEQAASSKAESVGAITFSRTVSPTAANKKESATQPPTEQTMGAMEQLAIPAAISMEREKQDILKPKPWIAKIRKLLVEGKTDAARKELKSFNKHYPTYTLPDDLKSF